MVFPALARWRTSRFGLPLGDTLEEKRFCFALLEGFPLSDKDTLTKGALALAAAYRVHNRTRRMSLSADEALAALNQAALDLARGHPNAERCVSIGCRSSIRPGNNDPGFATLDGRGATKRGRYPPRRLKAGCSIIG